MSGHYGIWRKSIVCKGNVWHWLFLLLLKAWEDLRAASSSCQHWNRSRKYRTTSLGKEAGRCLVQGAAHRSQRVRPDFLRLHPEDPQSLDSMCWYFCVLLGKGFLTGSPSLSHPNSWQLSIWPILLMKNTVWQQ